MYFTTAQLVLIEGGFVGGLPALLRRMRLRCHPRYFRMHLVGYFERDGLEWRCSDSLSLREFLLLEMRERVPDHRLSRTRARLPHEVTRRCLTGSWR